MSNINDDFNCFFSPIIALDAINDKPLASLSLLRRLSNYWAKRSSVKKDELEFKIFDEAKNDYPEVLLPFYQHPVFQSLEPEVKKKILSCARIAYSEKTLALENMIVNPLCVDILYGKLPGLHGDSVKQTISEVMTDETYHTLMAIKSTKVTREHRGLYFNLGMLNLVKHMKLEQSLFFTCWQKCIIQFTTTIIAEIFTSITMTSLINDFSIQPLHQKTVYAHYTDEAVHGSIFKELSKLFFAALNVDEKKFFIACLIKPPKWLADAELDNWSIMLNSIGVNNHKEMIEDCKINYIIKCKNIDYDPIIKFADEIGINKNHIESLL